MPKISELEDSRLINLIRVWCNLSIDGALPAKHDIDPADFACIGVLPMIWLLEGVDGDIVCRLAGEDILRAIGKPLRGRKISEIYEPASLKVILKQWNRVMDTRQTCHNKGVIVASQGRRYRGERIALPMADRDGRSRFILGVTLNTELHDLYPVEIAAEVFHKEPAEYTPWRDVVASFAAAESQLQARAGIPV